MRSGTSEGLYDPGGSRFVRSDANFYLPLLCEKFPLGGGKEYEVTTTNVESIGELPRGKLLPLIVKNAHLGETSPYSYREKPLPYHPEGGNAPSRGGNTMGLSPFFGGAILVKGHRSILYRNNRLSKETIFQRRGAGRGRASLQKGVLHCFLLRQEKSPTFP